MIIVELGQVVAMMMVRLRSLRDIGVLCRANPPCQKSRFKILH